MSNMRDKMYNRELQEVLKRYSKVNHTSTKYNGLGPKSEECIRLSERLDKLEDRFHKLRIKYACLTSYYDSKNAELKLTARKLVELQQKIGKTAENLFWAAPPHASNGVIELREIESRYIGDNAYAICLAGQKMKVGSIEYRGYHYSLNSGDIGYSIYSNFCGNGYAYQALCLLGEMLKKQGINDFWIYTNPNNEASKKTIEKYGGVRVEEIDGHKINPNICFYVAETFMLDRKAEMNNTK